MTVFVNKGDAPLTDAQLAKRTQAYINRDWPSWKRERSIRKNDGEFNAYMDQVSLDTDTNRANNTFNQQLADYRTAVARLAQYQVAFGREEVTEMQDTTEQQVDEEGMPIFDEEGTPVYVQQEVVVQTAIEPIEPTVERTVYSEDPMAEPTVETIENPLITQDNAERAAAQAVVDATPEAVVAAYEAE
jgi:hypothetical protein